MTSEPNELNPLLVSATRSDRRRILRRTTFVGLILLVLAPLTAKTMSVTLAGVLVLIAIIAFTVAYMMQRGLENDRWRIRKQPAPEANVASEPVVDLGLRHAPAPINLPIGPGRAGFEAAEDLLENPGEEFE